MNKKILSIFVMVMALSLLGVNCNKKTTDPTNDNSSSGSGSSASMLGLVSSKNNNTKTADLQLTTSSGSIKPAAGVDVTVYGFSQEIQTAGASAADLITYKVTGVKVDETASGNSASADASIVTAASFETTAGSAYNVFSINIKDNDIADNIQASFTASQSVTFIVTVTASRTGYTSISFPVYVKITSAAS